MRDSHYYPFLIQSAPLLAWLESALLELVTNFFPTPENPLSFLSPPSPDSPDLAYIGLPPVIDLPLTHGSTVNGGCLSSFSRVTSASGCHPQIDNVLSSLPLATHFPDFPLAFSGTCPHQGGFLTISSPTRGGPPISYPRGCPSLPPPLPPPAFDPSDRRISLSSHRQLAICSCPKMDQSRIVRRTPSNAPGDFALRSPTPAQHRWTILRFWFDQSWPRHCSYPMKAVGSILAICLDPCRLLPCSSPRTLYHSHQFGCS